MEKKGLDVVVLDVGKLTSVADYLILCSGESERQVRAIADHVHQTLAAKRTSPLSVEGTTTSQWVLLDFGDVVAHVFRADIRAHYGLEKLWADAKRVRVPTRIRPAPTSTPLPAGRRTVRVREQR